MRSLELANRLREVALKGKWIANTNLKELLSDVSLEQALFKMDDLNTIALLTFHLNYYTRGVLEVLKGGELTIRDKYSFDLPPLRDEQEWVALRADFLANAEALADAVENLEDAVLDLPFVKEEYGDYKRNIEAMIEHYYYHMGQVTLIKKMSADRISST